MAFLRPFSIKKCRGKDGLCTEPAIQTLVGTDNAIHAEYCGRCGPEAQRVLQAQEDRYRRLMSRSSHHV